jgi:hypothetical protein
MTDHRPHDPKAAPEATQREASSGALDRVARPARGAIDSIRTGVNAAAAAAEPIVERIG